MKVESFIESHQDHCDDDPIHLLNASSLSTLPVSVTPTGLSYDHRVKLFTELSKSLLFKHHDVKIADLKYWFPEYVQSPPVIEVLNVSLQVYFYNLTSLFT